MKKTPRNPKSTLSVAMLAAGLVAMIAIHLADRPSAQQQGDPCTWATVNNAYVAECVEWALPNTCDDCCLHYHHAMNVDKCLLLGDEEKGAKTKHFYTATTQTCAGGPLEYTCYPGETAACTHFEWECRTSECE